MRIWPFWRRMRGHFLAENTLLAWRGMMVLMAGAGIGRIITIASIPIISRLYRPDDFGVLAVFTSCILILSPIVTLRYVLALPVPRSDRIAMNLLVLNTVLLLVITTCLALVLWMFGSLFFSQLSMEQLTPWWWLIVLGILGTSFYEILTMWATRRRAYKVIAQTSVIQSIAGAFIKITLGLAQLQPSGLLLGQVVAQAGGVAKILSEFSDDIRKSWQLSSFSRLCRVAYHYKGFPLWRVPSQFLMTIALQGPILFMSSYYSIYTVGQFSFAMMVLAVPTNLLGNSAGKALYAEAARLVNTDPTSVYKMCRDMQLRLLFIASPLVVVLWFFGEKLFAVIFGSEWIEAGEYASIMAIALLFQITSAPMMQVMNLFSKQYVFLYINILRLLSLLIVFFVSVLMLFDARSTVILLSYFSTFFYLMITFYVLENLKKLQNGA